jgi:hypothetical protein
VVAGHLTRTVKPDRCARSARTLHRLEQRLSARERSREYHRRIGREQMAECLTHLMPMSSSAATVSAAQRKRCGGDLGDAARTRVADADIDQPFSACRSPRSRSAAAFSTRRPSACSSAGLTPREARESALERLWSMSANGALKRGARSGFCVRNPGVAGGNLTFSTSCDGSWKLTFWRGWHCPIRNVSPL